MRAADNASRPRLPFTDYQHRTRPPFVLPRTRAGRGWRPVNRLLMGDSNSGYSFGYVGLDSLANSSINGYPQRIGNPPHDGYNQKGDNYGKKASKKELAL